jgi:ferric-dicitrate binding protein FerR (iron transport regulator)
MMGKATPLPLYSQRDGKIMNHKEFQNTINSYFRGQLTDCEYKQLTEFLHDSANLELFEEAKKHWSLNAELSATGFQNWKRLEYKINKHNSTIDKTRATRRLWIQVASVAAILIGGIFGGSVLTYLFSNNKVIREELVFETPRGEKSLVTLPDGSKIWLNANSRLVYHSFSSTHRQVELKGEAFFNVVHNEKAPFVVKTDKCEVEVLGTTFNVMAYNEFGRQEITLLTGKVKVHTDNNEQDIKPGQALILKDDQVRVVEVNISQASGWVENKFNFKDIPLSELMKRLENWYDVDITLENNIGKEINYTGTFKNEETIWQVLDAIKVYTPIYYKRTDLRQIKITIIK